MQRSQFAGEYPQVLHIAEHHLADRAGDRAILDDGDPGHDRIVFADFLHVADFWFAGLGHDMHPRILNHVSDMFANCLFRVDVQKFAVSLVHHRHDPVLIDHDDTVKNTVDDRVQRTLKVFDLFQLGSDFLQLCNILKNRHRTDNLVILDDRRPLGHDLRVACLHLVRRLDDTGLEHPHQAGVWNHVIDRAADDIFRLHAGDRLGRRVKDRHVTSRVDRDDAIAHRVQNGLEFFGHRD